MSPVTYCGCGCEECINGHHCQMATARWLDDAPWHCNYTDHLTGPIGLIVTS